MLASVEYFPEAKAAELWGAEHVPICSEANQDMDIDDDAKYALARRHRRGLLSDAEYDAEIEYIRLIQESKASECTNPAMWWVTFHGEEELPTEGDVGNFCSKHLSAGVVRYFTAAGVGAA